MGKRGRGKRRRRREKEGEAVAVAKEEVAMIGIKILGCDDWRIHCILWLSLGYSSVIFYKFYFIIKNLISTRILKINFRYTDSVYHFTIKCVNFRVLVF